MVLYHYYRLLTNMATAKKNLRIFFGIFSKIFYQSLIADFEVKNSKTPRTTLIMNHDNCGWYDYNIAISSKQLQATYLITWVWIRLISK